VSALLDEWVITVAFGGVVANDDVAVHVEDGELVGVIGPNGAGKTTFIDAITGFVPCRGQVRLRDTELGGLDAAQRARAGLVRTWQSVELFDDLTVGENLAVATDRPRRFDLLRELVGRPPRPPAERIAETLARVGLPDVADALPHELSHGQRTLVGVARSLVAGPRLLCLDEPAAGLDETESAALGRLLRQLLAEELGLLLVDHDMALVMGVCDRIYVMDTGQVIAHGTPDEVRADPRVLDAYLGTEEASA
jgi:branched-chain amino acid transport system ATP-binding protein